MHSLERNGLQFHVRKELDKKTPINIVLDRPLYQMCCTDAAQRRIADGRG